MRQNDHYMACKFEVQVYRKCQDLVKDKEFAKELYAALCNMQWYSQENDYTYGSTWRQASALVSDFRCEKDYLGFYASGNEGTVTQRIRDIMLELGYVEKPYD